MHVQYSGVYDLTVQSHAPLTVPFPESGNRSSEFTKIEVLTWIPLDFY